MGAMHIDAPTKSIADRLWALQNNGRSFHRGGIVNTLQSPQPRVLKSEDSEVGGRPPVMNVFKLEGTRIHFSESWEMATMVTITSESSH